MRYLQIFLVAVIVGFTIAEYAHGATAQQQRLVRIHRQYVRDHGTVTFLRHHRWARHHRRFMRVEKRAERRIVLERAERAHVLAMIDAAFVAPWLATVRCENGGQWADSPGSFYLGLQFDPATWLTAARHTGVYGTTPHDQVVNATWTAREALREGAGDPWPNCPDPFYG